MKNEPIDISGKIGPLYKRKEIPEWPMYSYERPAYVFWNGFANGLKKAGFNDREIKDWLLSKLARWMLDGEGADEIEKLGEKLGKQESLEEFRKFMRSY